MTNKFFRKGWKNLLAAKFTQKSIKNEKICHNFTKLFLIMYPLESVRDSSIGPSDVAHGYVIINFKTKSKNMTLKLLKICPKYLKM